MKTRQAWLTVVLALGGCGTEGSPSGGSWQVVNDETLHTDVLLPTTTPVPPALAIDGSGRRVVAVGHADDFSELTRVDAMFSDAPDVWHHVGDVPGPTAHLVAADGETWLLAADVDWTPSLYRLVGESWELTRRFPGTLGAGPGALAVDAGGELHVLLPRTEFWGTEIVHYSSVSAWTPEPLGPGRDASLALGPGGEVGAIIFDQDLRVLRFVRPGAAPEDVVRFSDAIDLRQRLSARIVWGPTGPRVLAPRASGLAGEQEIVLFEREAAGTWRERVLFRDGPLPTTDGCSATAAGDVCPFEHRAHVAGPLFADGLMVVQEELVHGQYVWTCGTTCWWELGQPRRIEGSLLVGDPDAGFTRVVPSAPFGGGELMAVRAGGSVHLAAYVQLGIRGRVALRYLELALAAPPPLSCSDECEEGTTRCTDSGASLCVRRESGCTFWQSVDACPAGSTCSDGSCRPIEVEPAPRTLWASCSADTDCDSGVCYQFWGYVGTTWTFLGGLCSFYEDGVFPGDNPPPCAPGGAWYMPGCVRSYCLPACSTDADCHSGLTCDTGMNWNPMVCGYWAP